MAAARVRVMPPESYTVVMATGIVAVAARDEGHAAMAAVLAVLASVGLLVVLGWTAAAWAQGQGTAGGAPPIDRTFGQFGLVAALDVVAAQAGPPALVALLGATALLAWAVLLARLGVVVHTAGAAAVGARARGSWLLVAVASQSLALIAAQLSMSEATTSALIVAAAALWTTGVLAYLVIAVLVVRRLLLTQLDPPLLTPDLWVLMGALAIAVVAGGTLVDALHSRGVLAGLAQPGTQATLCCWLVASAWIPLLVGAEVRRVRRRRPGYEPSRWATVFPLGMYGVACTVLASLTPAARTGLHDASAAMFWIALAAWAATLISAIAYHAGFGGARAG